MRKMTTRATTRPVCLIVVALSSLLAGCAAGPPVTPVVRHDGQTLYAQAPVDPGTVHAWIINGDRARHHVANVRRATESLLRLGVPSSQIFVASEGGKPHRSIPASNYGVSDRRRLEHQSRMLREQVDSTSTVLRVLRGRFRPDV